MGMDITISSSILQNPWRWSWSRKFIHVLCLKGPACPPLAENFLLKEVVCDNHAAPIVPPPDGVELEAGDELPEDNREGVGCRGL